jgi:predicted short-subunit dehydrogenase-like oxidoreductase (DUF2520 family)
MKISIVGAGRAGTSFSTALAASGHDVQLVHHDELHLISAPDVILLTVPDDFIDVIALQIPHNENQIVAHVAGSRTLSVLGEHPRVASIHPLMALPSGDLGAARLYGATYCVAGDEGIREIATALNGRIITLSDEQRTLYHATAVVAANHLVALMGHVKELAEAAGLSLEDFLPLAEQSLRDVKEVGPQDALTGPASRGDMATIDAHLAALPEAERSTYVALANAAFELAEKRRSQLKA